LDGEGLTVGVWDEERTSGDEDPDFGKYTATSHELDSTLYDWPNLLSVWAAGNERGEQYISDPLVNDNWYLTKLNDVPYWVAMDHPTYPAPAPDGQYDCLGPYASAKNGLVVGAVDDITVDPYTSGNISITDFSSYGATDDGRIKPDVVGNGVDVYSSIASADDAYDGTYDGTSMATPNVTGTAVLLMEHFEDEFSTPTSSVLPSSAMTKGFLIHTASDAGNTGPDYSYGWGLVNGAAAADFISSAALGTSTDALTEVDYFGTEWTQELTYSGSDPLKATIVWTDPAGTPHGSGLDETTSVLVNDLDLWITGPGGTYNPWTLDPANPSNSAVRTTRNDLDNVEQVLIDSPTAGTYTVHVGDTGGVLDQVFSILISGASLVRDLVIDADDPGGNGTANAQADSFELVGHDDTMEVKIDDNFSRLVSLGLLDTITVNGSTDTDTMTVQSLGSDFQGQVTLNSTGSGDIAQLYDTGGNDSFVGQWTQSVLTAGGGYTVTANAFHIVKADSVNGGSDSADLQGSSGNDLLVFYAHTGGVAAAQMVGPDRTFDTDPNYHVVGFSTIVGDAGSGGDEDYAKFYDSPGDDLFVLNSDFRYALMIDQEGNPLDFSLAADGDFERVFGFSNTGGYDITRLYDSPGDDFFYATPLETAFQPAEGNPRDFFDRAVNFEEVHGFSPGGGYDVGYVFDSAGNDVFWVSPVNPDDISEGLDGTLTGVGFFNRVKNFDKLIGYASDGDEDKAYLYDTTGPNTYVGASTLGGIAVTGQAYYGEAHDFDKVYAEGDSTSDTAMLYDSPADDTFWANSTFGALLAPTYYNEAKGFNWVNAYTWGGGYDLAKFYDSAGDDTFRADAPNAYIWGPGFYHRAYNFELARGFCWAGGDDLAELYDSTGDDTFYLMEAESIAYLGSGQEFRAKDFETVHADARYGGNDTMHLYDSSTTVDLLEASGDTASVSNATYGWARIAEAFDLIYAHSSDGLDDDEDLQPPYDFILDLSNWDG